MGLLPGGKPIGHAAKLAPAADPQNKVRVLIVDNMVDMTSLFPTNLRRGKGYEVAIVPSIEEAKRQIEAWQAIGQQPDIVSVPRFLKATTKNPGIFQERDVFPALNALVETIQPWDPQRTTKFFIQGSDALEGQTMAQTFTNRYARQNTGYTVGCHFMEDLVNLREQFTKSKSNGIVPVYSAPNSLNGAIEAALATKGISLEGSRRK